MLTSVVLSLVLFVNAGTQQASANSEIILEGTITPADRLAWLERAFVVPAGTARIDVETSFTNGDQGTAVEFGVYDPVRFRGSSRVSKTSFFISRTAATPSYHPGELQPGQWRLLMGVQTIRDGVTSRYRIVVRLTPEGSSQPSPTAVTPNARASGPRWYQGDLHTHTLHSDGYKCADGRGGAGPCAVHQVVDAAVRQGLDFVAVTDHNTTSHHQDLTALQPLHDHLLLLRGQEVTSFYGHANVYGTSEIVDFRIGHPGVTAREVFAQTRRLGGLLSINHPARETGETCTGCGWNAPG
ncbi:MAG: PHP domain-containing protein, partial [Acidobacteria bacterium]|nr:PHP domain-containing protein [Acidobacteriota bacterium]